MSSSDIPISLVWLKKTARKSLVCDKSVYGRLHRKNSREVQSQAGQAGSWLSFSALHNRPQGRIKAKLIAAVLQCTVHHLQTRTISRNFSLRNFQHKTCFTKARCCCISSFQLRRASCEEEESLIIWVGLSVKRHRIQWKRRR